MKVMFATPCYISAVSMNYVTSIFSLTAESMRHGLTSLLHMHSESLITRGRNKMVIEFLLREDFTHLHACPAFDDLVRVHELELQLAGRQPTHGRFAHAHEAHQRDVPNLTWHNHMHEHG